MEANQASAAATVLLFQAHPSLRQVAGFWIIELIAALARRFVKESSARTQTARLQVLNLHLLFLQKIPFKICKLSS